MRRFAVMPRQDVQYKHVCDQVIQAPSESLVHRAAYIYRQTKCVARQSAISFPSPFSFLRGTPSSHRLSRWDQHSTRR